MIPARPRRRRVHVTWAREIGQVCVRASMTLLNGSKERMDEGSTSYAGASCSQAQGGRQAAGRGVRVARAPTTLGAVSWVHELRQAWYLRTPARSLRPARAAHVASEA